MGDASPYDGLLLVSFGGPERPEDVLPFLANVTRGRGVPPARLAEVAEHYAALGGRSPINDQCRALLAAVRADLDAAGVDIAVYWGNRNWAPFLASAVREMRDDGVRRVAAFVTSAYSSYSGCRQYRENLFDAVAEVPGAPVIDRLRQYYNHPGFIGPFVEAACDARQGLPAEVRERAVLLFVTHSIPTSMADTSGPDGGWYVEEHRSAAALVAEGVAERTGTGAVPWRLAYCSRSGPPHLPWLEPDVNGVLVELAAAKVPAVVTVPIGFVSDHVEVLHDLDTEAAETADRCGIAWARAATPGTHPSFVAMVRDLLLERAAAERGQPVQRASLGQLGAGWDTCDAGCCRNLRGSRGSLGETPAVASYGGPPVEPT